MNDTETLAERLKRMVAESGPISHHDEPRPKLQLERPSRAEREEEEDDTPVFELSAADLSPIFVTLGNMVFGRLQVTLISEDEGDELGRAFSPLVTKYFGHSLDRWGLEVAALIVLAKISVPRGMEYYIRQNTVITNAPKAVL